MVSREPISLARVGRVTILTPETTSSGAIPYVLAHAPQRNRGALASRISFQSPNRFCAYPTTVRKASAKAAFSFTNPGSRPATTPFAVSRAASRRPSIIAV